MTEYAWDASQIKSACGYIEAESENEARRMLFDQMNDDAIDWEIDSPDLSVWPARSA